MGAWHVTRAQTGPRLRLAAGKAAGRAAVDHLGSLAGERHLYVAHHSDGVRVHIGVERPFEPLYFAGFGRPAFRLPCGQTTIENEHVTRTENSECPPHPGR